MIKISKENKMSRRKNNKKMATQMTDEQIKAVMDLYSPNIIQKIFMKYFSKIETTSRPRQIVTVISIILFAMGIVFNSPAEIITALIIALPLSAGIIYGIITNKKRISQLMSVLNMTEPEILTLETKYYLS
jgi:hypothetical protein